MNAIFVFAWFHIILVGTIRILQWQEISSDHFPLMFLYIRAHIGMSSEFGHFVLYTRLSQDGASSRLSHWVLYVHNDECQ